LLPQSCHNVNPQLYTLSPLYTLIFCVSCRIVRVGSIAAAFPFGLIQFLPQWQLVLPPSASFRPNPKDQRPKSIHSYLCQTKSKSFMPFLGRRQLFFSQFYWQSAISGSWNLPKRKSFLPLFPTLSPSPSPSLTVTQAT